MNWIYTDWFRNFGTDWKQQMNGEKKHIQRKWKQNCCWDFEQATETENLERKRRGYEVIHAQQFDFEFASFVYFPPDSQFDWVLWKFNR